MADFSDLIARFNEAYQQGRYAQAAEICAQLANEYSQSGDMLAAAEAQNNLSVALVKAGKFQEAYDAAAGTDQTFAAAGDARRQALALGNQAAALEGLRKLEEAAGLYRQSAELLEKIGDRELYSIVMKSLTAVYLKQGKQMDSVISLQSSLAGDRNFSPREKFLKGLLKRVLSFLR